MQVYVSTYAKYSAGTLAGDWINPTEFDDKEQFYLACHNLHANEVDPEFMFQDHEGIPAALIGESWVDERVWDIENDEEAELVDAYADCFGIDHLPKNENIVEIANSARVAIEWDDLIDSFIYDCPEHLRCYIDEEMVKRDLECSYIEHEETGFIFDRNH